MGSKTNNSVLIIGLDGATWDLLLPWIQEGKLPFFNSCLKQGVYGELESTLPPLTGPAWASFATGKNPGKHGIYSFKCSLRNYENSELVNSSHVHEPRVWDILDRFDNRSCIINMPLTYPPSKINGVMISSILTPLNSDNFTYPSSLSKSLKEKGYQIDLKFDKYGFLPGKRETIKKRNELYDKQLNITRKRFSIAKDLLTEDWDFFFLLIKGTDIVQHLFWDQPPHILEFYQFLENLLADFLTHFRSKNEAHSYYFLISDHGFQASAPTAFCIYPWLKSSGYLGIKEDPSQFLKWGKSLYRNLKKWIGIDLRKVNKLKQKHHSQLNKLTENLSIKACPVGLFINPEKVRGEGEYTTLRHKIIEGLRSVEDASGKPVFSVVSQREKVYSGPKLNQAPDILYLPSDDFLINPSIVESQKFVSVDSFIPGAHFSKTKGIFIAGGDQIKGGGSKLTDLSIMDVVPTILHILNVPLLKEMDGKVIRDSFKSNGPLADRDPHYLPSSEIGKPVQGNVELEPYELEEVKTRLKGLGYLDSE